MNIKSKGRYSTFGSDEGEFEPGSRNLVLKNLFGIKRKKEIEVFETTAYDTTVTKVLDKYNASHSFTANDIRDIHKLWLGKIYSWAGEYRSVNMAKGDFQFASAHIIPKLMAEFQKEVLERYTPCHYSDIDEIAEAIAIVHTEFIQKNGRHRGNQR